jgi:DNA-binding CsgD family transcriptional regulator
MLNEKERRIVALLREGKTVREIAEITHSSSVRLRLRLKRKS